MLKQKLFGIGLLLVSILIIMAGIDGKSFEDSDVTAVLFTLPISLYTIFTKHKIIN